MSYSETVTKEDLKNVLNEVLPQSRYIQSWEYVGDVYWWGNTWTVPDDGFIEVYVEPSASNWYWRISDSKAPDTGWSHRLTGANALTVSQEFFVKKGAVLGTSSMNAVSTVHVYYYKFTLKETTPESAVDYIVEQGTSDGWTYRKWNSGIAECWCNISESFAMTNALGSVYYGQKSYSISSLGFNAIGDIQVTGNCAAYYVTTKVESYSTTSLTLTALSSASRTDTIKHFIKIVGTWK